MKNKIYKFARFVPMVIMMIVIFIYSAMPADESTEVSDSLAETIIEIVENVTGNTIQQSSAEFMSYAVRKAAHFSEYALLAVTVCIAFLPGSTFSRKKYIFCWGLSTVYAITDEFHQLFVPGRSGQIKDVCIDAAGAMLGVFLSWTIYRINNRKRLKRQN